jgi:hypothetical protein
MDLQTQGFLDARNVDAVLAVAANLFGEVVVLQERVAELEVRAGLVPADRPPSTQERVDALVSRVFGPLNADHDLA